jgi:hypothetical protein
MPDESIKSALSQSLARRIETGHDGAGARRRAEIRRR